MTDTVDPTLRDTPLSDDRSSAEAGESETVGGAEVGPGHTPDTASITEGVGLASQLLNDHPDDVEFAVRKICAQLHTLTASATVCRVLFHAALLDGSPLRARFVSDLLSRDGRTDLARILVDHAISSDAKPWQKRRLRAVRDAAPQTPTVAGTRQEFTLQIADDGRTTLGGGDGTTGADTWLPALLRRIEASPLGIHHDVVRIRAADTSTASTALRTILETLVSLPLIPLVIADSHHAAMSIIDEVDVGVRARSRTVVLAPSTVDGHVIVSIGGSELVGPGPTDDLVLSSRSDLSALAAAYGLVCLGSSPTLRTRTRDLLDAFRLECSQLLPMSSRTRAIRRVLRFAGTTHATSAMRTSLTGHLLASGFYDEALGLIDSSPTNESGRTLTARRIRALFGTGRFAELVGTSDVESVSAADRSLVTEAIAADAMCAELDTVPAATSPPFAPVPGRILTILHASAPEQSGGYAVRAHGVLRSIADHGYEVTALTRPGFPEATNTLAPGETEELVHDGVRYLRLGTSTSRAAGEFAYMRESIDHYVSVIRTQRPALVHLRSTYVSALPGLIAARRLGLPVVYEISGMWELVFETANTAQMEGRRARTIELENAVIARADAVVTITKAMCEIISGGVETARPIEIVPNAVDTSEFAPRAKDVGLLARLGWNDSAPVVGYIGSFVGYEGLDVLVRAIAEVRRRGQAVRGLFVGDGAEAGRLRCLSEDLGLDGSAIVFTGRVPHKQVREFYSIIDVCAYPRLLTPATRAVSPLKPFEAMAAQIPVVVSDVPALAEIAGHGERARVVASGDVEALAGAIEDAITDSPGTDTMVAAAAEWTAAERSWSAVGRVMSAVMEGVLS